MPATTIIQPSESCTGVKFEGSITPCVLQCGCVVTNREVEAIATDTGFVECPVCEIAYAAASKKAILQSTVLDKSHEQAQLRRCAYFEKQIHKLEQELDVMFEGGDPVLADNSDDDDNNMELDSDLKFVEVSTESSVDDDSWDDGADFLSFACTQLSKLQRRLKNLKDQRDTLTQKKANKMKSGKKAGLKWANDDYKPKPDSLRSKLISIKAIKRMERRAARAEAQAKLEEQSGSAKIVHSVEYLGKNVPKKWRNTDPNATKTPEQELKERAKQGWLTEQEQEELDEEAQEAVKAERIAAWKKEQGAIPKLFGAVRRVRWANRIYKATKREYTINQKIAKAEADGTDEGKMTADRWRNRATQIKEKEAGTRIKMEGMIVAMKAAKKFELAAATKTYFEEAEQIGKTELAEELEARKKAEEEEIKRAKAEKKAAAKAEKKAARKAAAEEAGEDYDDEAEVSTDPEEE